MFSPLKKHNGIHQTYFSFCRIARNVNKLKWLRSLLILDSVIYILILLQSCPDKSPHWLILCTVPSTPVAFLLLLTLNWTFPLEMRRPLHTLTQLCPACWRGPSKHASDGSSDFPPNVRKTWPSSFLQGLLDNPRQTALRCGHPNHEKTATLLTELHLMDFYFSSFLFVLQTEGLKQARD